MKFQYNFNTNIGLKRQQNQDSGFVLPDHGLFLLADGMGGHSGGEIASKLVVQCVSEYFTNTINEKQDLPDMMNPNELVQNSIRAANLAIYQRSTEDIELQGMGTTTVMLLFNNQKLIIGNVGDSRCYFFRPQCIWQLTKDHSLVQEKLRAGLITREQLRTDKSKNVITRSVGFEPHLMVDLYETN
ncbi:MAG: serine/threonine-protein phosphatase, partial [Deltaproteobacteria bacterium]|nr:serine/threonine-protein phosphatase [Deltaproteobacteria bacterium]